MTDEHTEHLKASRLRLPRSRGALGGLLLIIGGVWAALVPFVGPYGNFAYTPSPDTAWKWTAARGWLEVLPGAAAVLGGLLLLTSTNRLVAILGGWIAALAGCWLVIGPSLSGRIGLDIGRPDPKQSAAVNTAEELLFFYAIGAAIVLIAALSIGRLSVHGIRDVRAAERRAAAAAEEERLAAERAAEERRLAEEREREEHKRMLDERHANERARIAEEHRARQGADEHVDPREGGPGAPGEPLPVADGHPGVQGQPAGGPPIMDGQQPPVGSGPHLPQHGQRPPDNPPPFYGNQEQPVPPEGARHGY